MSQEGTDMRICKRCDMVEGWRGFGHFCFRVEDHQLVEAVVVDCPFLERTPTGRVTPKRIRMADRACLAAPEGIYESHHFGDPHHRHIMTPSAARRFDRALAAFRAMEVTK